MRGVRTVTRGFTIVEVLVVLVIVGIVTTYALFTVRAGGESRLARDEVRRLDALVELAVDDAMQRMFELGVEFHRSGYRFVVWNGEAWVPYVQSRAFRAHEWVDGLRVTLVVEGAPIALPASPPRDPRPQVVFLSSGETSAFELIVADAEGHGERLQVTVVGERIRTPFGGER